MKNELSGYEKRELSLRQISNEIQAKPKAVLVILGHWEECDFTVMGNSHPPMIYDSAGFPAHAYQIKYAAPGLPALAEQVQSLIQAAGFSAKRDDERGFDHGTFVPLFVMCPDASVPVVQLSLHSDYDPERHFKLGRVLAPLRDQGVLIIRK